MVYSLNIDKPLANHNKNTSHAKESQKIKIKKKTKTPRITDEGWNSQKRLSDPEDERREKKEEKIPVSSSKALFRFSSPIGSFTE